MTSSGALACAVVVAAVLVPLLGAAQPLPSPDTLGDTLHPVLDPVVARGVPVLEQATGQDLDGEDIAAVLVLDVRNVDDDVIGIVFGGGKVAVDALADFRLDFRAVSTERLDEAVRAFTGDANASLESTFGVPSNRTALTAEEIRVVGAGQLLAAFQAYELAAAERYLENTLPGLSITDLAGSWRNTVPASGIRSGHLPGVPDPYNPYATLGQPPIPPLREPPLVLEARARLEYVDRFSLLEILTQPPSESPKADLQKRIEATQSDAFVDRTAFRILGLKQLLDFQVPPGWRFTLVLTVPQGFTIEGATDELVVSPDHRSLTYHATGDGRVNPLAQAGVVAVSTRFVVTLTVLCAVLLAGFMLRLPIEMATMRIAYALQRGPRVERPSLSERTRARLPVRWGRRQVQARRP